MTVAVVFALLLQQAATGQVVWDEPAPPPAAEAPAAPLPDLPDWARADPFAWERAECSPLMRKDETLEACQARVRAVLAAHLGDALPAGLKPAALEDCRQAETGDRYAVQCGAPSRAGPAVPPLQERVCDTRPRAMPNGAVVWTEDCRSASGEPYEDEGLKLRIGGRDD